MVASTSHRARMFLIPLARKFDWRHPPVVTFLIVLANVLVYAIWQSPDQERREQALVHYFESGLARLELPLMHATSRSTGARSGLPWSNVRWAGTTAIWSKRSIRCRWTRTSSAFRSSTQNLWN
jgi:hypothetical protein